MEARTTAASEESPFDRQLCFSPKAVTSVEQLRSAVSPATASRRPFRQVQPVNAPHTQKLTSPANCSGSDFKHASLAQLTSAKLPSLEVTPIKGASFDSNLERHSSEEELSEIHKSATGSCRSSGSREKRKHSDVSPPDFSENRDRNCSGVGCSDEVSVEMFDENTATCFDVSRSPQTDFTRGKLNLSITPNSADEEVKDVWFHSKPSKFSASPPRGVRSVRLQTVSPRKFLANVAPGASASLHSVTSSQSCWKSPRKRQRQLSRNDSDEFPVIQQQQQRPFIDLEKMQVSAECGLWLMFQIVVASVVAQYKCTTLQECTLTGN